MPKQTSRIVTFSNLVTYNPKGMIGAEDQYIPVQARVSHTLSDSDIERVGEMGVASAQNFKRMFNLG